MKSSSTVTPLELKQYEIKNIIKVIQEAKQRDEKRQLNLSLVRTREEREDLQYRYKQEMAIERKKIECLKKEYDAVQKYMLEQSHNHAITSLDDDNSDGNENNDSYQITRYQVPSSSSFNKGSNNRFGSSQTAADLQLQKEFNLKFERSTLKSQLGTKKVNSEFEHNSERKQVYFLIYIVYCKHFPNLHILPAFSLIFSCIYYNKRRMFYDD